MGDPAFQLQDIIKENKINVFSANYTLYGDISKRVMNIPSSFVPDVEIYSIDESFLDFRGFDMYDLQCYGREIVEYTTKATGIPVSMGIAPTKTLAKVANKFAKEYPGYKEVCIIDTEEKRIRALQLTEIGDVWGVGRRYAKKLNGYGIYTAYDFCNFPSSWVRKQMPVVGASRSGTFSPI